MARTVSREKVFQWIDIVASTDSHLIGLKSNKDINIESIEDAKKYQVAVLRDDVTHELLLSHGFIENKNLYIVNNTHSLLKLLSTRNSIDLILADSLTVKYRAIYNDIEPSLFKTFFQINKSPLDFYFACNLNTDREIIDFLRQAMTKIKQNGEHQAIENSWKMLK